jgi:hypothetical protein
MFVWDVLWYWGQWSSKSSEISTGLLNISTQTLNWGRVSIQKKIIWLIESWIFQATIFQATVFQATIFEDLFWKIKLERKHHLVATPSKSLHLGSNLLFCISGWSQIRLCKFFEFFHLRRYLLEQCLTSPRSVVSFQWFWIIKASLNNLGFFGWNI